MSSPYSPYPQGGGDQYGGPGQPYQPYPQGSGGWEPGARQGYLQGAPVGFGGAISEGLKNLTTFNGRASRSAFWWYTLGLFIIGLILGIIVAASKATAASYALDAVYALLSLALAVRRLHDSGRSGFWWFIGLIPIVGAIVLIVFYCMPGTPGPNQYDV